MNSNKKPKRQKDIYRLFFTHIQLNENNVTRTNHKGIICSLDGLSKKPTFDEYFLIGCI